MLQEVDKAMGIIREVYPDIQIASATIDAENFKSKTLLTRDQSAAYGLKIVEAAAARHGRKNVGGVFFCYSMGSRVEKIGIPMAKSLGSLLFQDEISHLASHFMVETGVGDFPENADLFSNVDSECRVFQSLPPRNGNRLVDIIKKAAEKMPEEVEHLVILYSAGWGRINRDVYGAVPVKGKLMTFHAVALAYSDHSTCLELSKLLRKLHGYGLCEEGLVALNGDGKGGSQCPLVHAMWEAAHRSGSLSSFDPFLGDSAVKKRR